MKLTSGLFRGFEISDLPTCYLAHLLSTASISVDLQRAIELEFTARCQFKTRFKTRKKPAARGKREAA